MLVNRRIEASYRQQDVQVIDAHVPSIIGLNVLIMEESILRKQNI